MIRALLAPRVFPSKVQSRETHEQDLNLARRPLQKSRFQALAVVGQFENSRAVWELSRAPSFRFEHGLLLQY